MYRVSGCIGGKANDLSRLAVPVCRQYFVFSLREESAVAPCRRRARCVAVSRVRGDECACARRLFGISPSPREGSTRRHTPARSTRDSERIRASFFFERNNIYTNREKKRRRGGYPPYHSPRYTRQHRAANVCEKFANVCACVCG